MGGIILGAIGAKRDREANQSMNERNISFQRETNQWNERLMREAWARDDNAIQRRRADMEAAGFSPLLAPGSPAGNSPVASMIAPKQQTPISKGAAKYLNVGFDNALRMAQTGMQLAAIQKHAQSDAIAKRASAFKDATTAAIMAHNHELDTGHTPPSPMVDGKYHHSYRGYSRVQMQDRYGRPMYDRPRPGTKRHWDQETAGVKYNRQSRADNIEHREKLRPEDDRSWKAKRRALNSQASRLDAETKVANRNRESWLFRALSALTGVAGQVVGKAVKIHGGSHNP
jgi:hypothetical protein